MTIEFFLCDCLGGFTRKQIVRDVSDISEAFAKLDNYIHDDEYVLNYQKIKE